MTLERRKPLRGNPAKAREWERRSRKRLPAESEKRKADRDRRADVRAEVFRRDGYRCQLGDLGGCWGRLEMHERRKAAQMTGGYTVENGATLCRGHNQAVEQDADLAAVARERGLVLLREDV